MKIGWRLLDYENKVRSTSYTKAIEGDNGVCLVWAKGK